jgi:hypothetical protein
MSFSRTVVHVLVFWRGARGRQRVRTWALDVADDGTGLVVHELDTALGDTTTGACNISVSLPFSQVTLHPPRFLDCALPLSLLLVGGIRKFRVPVRPRTRVTLTRLTGALAESILCDCEFRRESVRSVYGRAGLGVRGWSQAGDG